MSRKICVLSDITINQIAAGEVIENPASVVKELVENAIDAGARHVKIEVLGGGFQLLKVSDDGSGMSPEDAALCLQRHATSKIVAAEDLFSLMTMGFRGEALSSIASISKWHLLTALESATATSLEGEGGNILHVAPGARARGTTIEVRSLFFNVPARKKFQKSPSASSAEITKIVTQLALAHPEVGFDLMQQNRSHFSLPPSSGEEFLAVLKRRAEPLLGSEFLSSARDFWFKEKEYAGQGLIADPLFSRHNRSGESIFVNHRPVSCPAISYAIRDAYGTRLNSDRYPVYLLHLRIPSPLVDVNVHPQKKQIRLREESLLKHLLHSSVSVALGGQGPSAAKEPPFSPFFSHSALSDFSSAFSFKEEEDELPAPELPLHHSIHVIGLHGPYALVSAESLPLTFFPDPQRRSLGVVWIDLPAAEARVEFERLLSRGKTHPLSQGLLLPLVVQFSRAEMGLLETHLGVIERLGIVMRQVGELAFLIEGIPPCLNEGEVESFLQEMLGELQGFERGKTHEQDYLRKVAATLSRKTRFSRRFYSREEALLIVQKLIASSDPLFCPQGKRTLFHIRENDIENYFG